MGSTSSGYTIPDSHSGARRAQRRHMAGARSHEGLIAWQLANELKLRVYALVRAGTAARDFAFADQLRRSAAAAPRNIAEGFGRYLPGEFTKYLRFANGEIKETYDALQDGCDRGHFSRDEVLQLLRLAKRASKAATNLIAYLRTATPPDRRLRGEKRGEPPEPQEPH